MTPRTFAPFLSLFLLANVLDLVTTIIGLQRGIPVMALILAHYGLVAMDTAKLALMGVIVCLCWRLARRNRRHRFVPLAFGLVMLCIVALNILTIGGLA